MLTVARRPRMIVLLLIFLAAAAVCARLGVWQLDRAQERGELAAAHAAAELASQGPESLGSMLEPQTTFPGDLVGRQAWVEGEYDPAGQQLVAGRAHDGQEGFLVLTPMRVSDDGTGGASWADLSGAPILPVVRGWVPADPSGQSAALTAEQLAPPQGTVRLTGYLQASEAKGYAKLPEGQTDSISSAALANVWGGPIYAGYLVVVSSAPGQDVALALLDRPSIEGGDGLNLQNLFYALQWWIFGAFAVALWLRTVRDEARGSDETVDVNPFAALD
ncbi:Cytochrome oxidase assembly protein ShyY1 [Sanguibacter gelidistatuariae]|uniref:SURF1-like protein n=2 Tax=Sanguibacter gelidistatuariae TaxID=1814289 RepID=A0A1G6KMD6_9MICO|nr:Cytochrome oxidase assembly protein ShyY1 [Sanguibacter gelidistatuariae]